MRLLNTSTLKLYEFHNAEIPNYAILSHTWTEQEVSLQMLEDPKSRTLAGYTKIERCCELALSEGWKYAWIDTCCIDKTSSADLSEAVNAMYSWYESAQVCYVYLNDVRRTTKFGEAFRSSRWFFRGWTLQELLAPRTVVFYNRDWQELGTKWSLRDEISRTTGIMYHQMIDHKRVSVATKMSWAALRETTRVEDTAYSLLGLFGINMPLLYGEGSKAFMRLQHEILQTHENYESIFAWRDAKLSHCGLLAPSPAAFALSGDIVSVKNPNQLEPPIVTKKRLTMTGFNSRSEYRLHDSIHYTKKPAPFIILNCVQQGVESDIIGIELTEREMDYFSMSSSGTMERRSSFLDYFVRLSPGKLLRCKDFRGSSTLKDCEPDLFQTLMEISLDHTPFVPANQQQYFTAIVPSLVHCGFVPSEKYPNGAAFTNLPSVFPLTFRPEGWKIMLDLSRSTIAALMFRSENEEAFAIVLTARESGVSVDVFLPEGNETLRDIVNRFAPYLQQRGIADHSYSELQAMHDVCATSRRRFVNYELVYFVDVKISKLVDAPGRSLDLFRQRFLAVETQI